MTTDPGGNLANAEDEARRLEDPDSVPSGPQASIEELVAWDRTLVRSARHGLSDSAWFLLSRLYELDRERQLLTLTERERRPIDLARLCVANLAAEWQAHFMPDKGVHKVVSPRQPPGVSRHVEIAASDIARSVYFHASRELIRFALARPTWGSSALELTTRGRWVLRPEDRLQFPLRRPVRNKKKGQQELVVLDGEPYITPSQAREVLQALHSAFPDTLRAGEVLVRAFGTKDNRKLPDYLSQLPESLRALIVNEAKGYYALTLPLLPGLPGQPRDWVPSRYRGELRYR